MPPAQEHPGSRPTPDPQTILVVDDEADILESLKDLLEASLEGVVVRTATGGQAALEVLRGEPVHLIVTDYKMPRMDGLQFLREAHGVAPTVPRILITAFPDLDIAIKAINDAGIENFITKPFEPGYVVEVVRTLLQQQRAEVLRNQSFARSLELMRQQMSRRKA